LELKAEPKYQKIIKWQNAIPQYIVGHSARMENIDKHLDQMGNIFLAGNAYSGIGLNDTIKRSYQIAENIAL